VKCWSSSTPKLVVDLTPPHVAPREPVPRTRVAASPPRIVAGVLDSVGAVGGGMEVDGLSVPAELTLDDANAQVVEWDPEQSLCAGTHKVRVSVVDAAGHPAQARWSFRVAGHLTRACARSRCANGRRAVRVLRRQISFDAGARARALRRARRARHRADRVRYRRVAARWQRERTEDKRSLREQRAALRVPCRIAHR